MTLRQYGSLEVLQQEDLPVPSLLPGEVRVKVQAVGTNPVDTKCRWSAPYTDFPVVLGWDISSVVNARDTFIRSFGVVKPGS